MDRQKIGRWTMDHQGKLGAKAMKRVAAGAHLPTPWHFKPAKRPDGRAKLLLGLQFPPPVEATETRFYP